MFKFDDVAPDLLHIYARHLTTSKEDIETFFERETSWNEVLLQSLRGDCMGRKERYEIEDLGEVELDAETDAKVNRMISEADREIEETRVSFRWGKEQLSIVKEAAERMGVPYQTFIKMCVYQRALDVLKDVQAAKPKNAA